MSRNHHTLIIGAGSAGCVLANRLSADESRRVTLVEAGPDYGPGPPEPEDLRDGGKNSFTRHDWGYWHDPTDDQHVPFKFPRGKVVGGSSAVNTCIALRGRPEDYDQWAELGLDQWSWEDCLPAFRRLESDLDYADSEWHGENGPIPIRRHPPDEWTPWQEAVVETLLSKGVSYRQDWNRPGGSEMVGPHPMNKIDGRRISAAEAYLTKAVRQRPNFELQPETLVHRIEFDGRTATGVRVEDSQHGMYSIDADRIVVAAGAINTPAILVRSGVGPADDLQRLGVEPVAEVPAVANRLLDHPGAAIVLWPKFGSGTSRHHDIVQTLHRYDSELSPVPNDIIMQPASSFPLPWATLPLVNLAICLGKPKGHGELTITSTDPHDAPSIRSRLFAHPEDRAVAINALQRAFDVISSPPASEMVRVIWPTRGMLRDDDRLGNRLESVCDSGYHPCGTVPMGPRDADWAACDGHGRLKRVDGLRVADASLIPTIPCANINLTVMMIAERLASLWSDQSPNKDIDT